MNWKHLVNDPLFCKHFPGAALCAGSSKDFLLREFAHRAGIESFNRYLTDTKSQLQNLQPRRTVTERVEVAPGDPQQLQVHPTTASNNRNLAATSLGLNEVEYVQLMEEWFTFEGIAEWRHLEAFDALDTMAKGDIGMEAVYCVICLYMAAEHGCLLHILHKFSTFMYQSLVASGTRCFNLQLFLPPLQVEELQSDCTAYSLFSRHSSRSALRTPFQNPDGRATAQVVPSEEQFTLACYKLFKAMDSRIAG